MNIFNKVTLKNLSQNKTRTAVTIIGVILSAAMITAVATFATSMQRFMLNYVGQREGTWQGAAHSQSVGKIAELEKGGELKEFAVVETIGYAKIKSKNEYKPYLYVQGIQNKQAAEMLGITLTDGRMPENSNEILIPEHVNKYLNIPYKVGDRLKLSLGERKIEDETLGQRNPFVPKSEGGNESLDVNSIREYKIVGICERPGREDYAAPGFTCVTRSAQMNDGGKYDLYFILKHPGKIYDFISCSFGENTADALSEGTSVEVHSELLRYMGVSDIDGFNGVLYSIATIVILLIMIGSISLIYNAFSISISERTKQFGLMSSIGATKKQIKASVMFEAFCISAVGIPLGILAGIGGAAATLYFVGGILSDMINGSNLELSIYVSWMSIVVAAAVALITVLISAVVPSFRAGRITPMEAIRRSGDVKLNPKKLRSPRLLKWIFKAEGVIAGKNFKRSRKKYRSTVVSLTMSIVLFVSVTAFTGYMTDSIYGMVQDIPYDVTFDEENMSDKHRALFDDFSKISGVTQSGIVVIDTVEIAVPVENIDKSYFDNSGVENVSDIKEQQFFATLNFLPDDAFREYARSSNLNPETFFKGSLKTIVAKDENLLYNHKIERVEKVSCLRRQPFSADILGEYKQETDTNERLKNLEITAFTEKLPFGVTAGGNLCLILPESRRNEVGYHITNLTQMAFKTDDHSAFVSEMQRIYKEKTGEDQQMLGIMDYTEMMKENRNILLIFNVFFYGFITLISLIAVANVFNTISTNISLRRREFAMLRSVGMTNRGFNKIMMIECIMYGLKSLVYGIPISALISYVMYKGMASGIDTDYLLPVASMGIAAGAVFAIVMITMLYSMQKIKKQNTIEALKSENA